MNEKEKIREFKEWLIDKERSQNTIDAYCRSIKIFYKTFQNINKENMLKFKKELLESKKPKTAHNRIVALNQYCLFLGHPEYTVKSIRIHNSSSVENVISKEEYETLLTAILEDGNVRGYWLIKFLAKTGARVSEFIKIPKSALDEGYVEMWTKGKIRRIYIPEKLIEESRDYFAEQKGYFLFCNRYGNQLTARGVSQNLRNWGRKYGIRTEVMHPHSFRHLYAIEFLKKNPNIALLADLMGHSSVSTTSIYLKLSKEEQMRQFNEASTW